MTKRSLILAGGGLKVAFQAGVLQVWLDEARDPDGNRLEFDHADGASGGVFNLAMWCQGMSGRQIADNWRRTRPLRGAAPNWRHWLPRFSSVLDYDRFRRAVLRETWHLNWAAIRATKRDATFNVFDFGRQELKVLPAADMHEDALIAAVSLPFWFPPVEVDNSPWVDAVFATDSNIGTAIERGSDEIWVIWTVSEKGRWQPGPVGAYFAMIEEAANARVREWKQRIQSNNAAGDHGEFGRHIELKWLVAEVPVHYLFVWTNDQIRAAVEQGVTTARRWCRELGYSTDNYVPDTTEPSWLSFREKMGGPVAFGEDSPGQGRDAGAALGTRLELELTVAIDDLREFLDDLNHPAVISGTVICQELGGRLPITGGELQLLPEYGDPERTRMEYRLWFRDRWGNPLLLSGVKYVVDDPGPDMWSDTTTLETRIELDDPLAEDRLVASGVLRLSTASFLRQLLTLRAGGTGALPAFGKFFLRRLWQVYGVGRRKVALNARN